MNTKYYDIVIIGSGIAGLYSAYQITKDSPSTSFVVLEKNKKKWIGGRINNETFYDTTIVTGAGIGREDTNPLLLQLMKELHIPYEKKISVMNYATTISKPIDVKKIITFLRGKYTKNPSLYHSMTFQAFGKKMLGDDLYHKFTVSAGYTDYEKADVYETLYHYGMDDNEGGWPVLLIPWKKLIDCLCEKIGYEHIQTSTHVINVDKIQSSPCLFEITTKKGLVYYSRRVIVGTTISGIRTLVPGASDPSSLYQQIQGQTFLRLYGKFNKRSTEIMKKAVPAYTIVPGPLQKIIPMNSEKGVYMIAYSDNENAVFLKKYLANTSENRESLCLMIEQSLGLPFHSLQLIAIKDFYWPIGTHYYEPLRGPYRTRTDFIRHIQHPLPGLLVVGEAVSRYQGWVEGALESVQAVVTKKWLTSSDCD